MTSAISESCATEIAVDLATNHQLASDTCAADCGWERSGHRTKDAQHLAIPIPRQEARYFAQEQIGAGGMGTIRRVYDSVLQRAVAMKEMHADLCVLPNLVEAFSAEARISARLDHPNIVPIHDIQLRTDDARPYFFMKLVEGESLAQQIHAREGRLPSHDELSRVLSLFDRVCDALAFAHSRHVLHLDLKPANIMLSEHGRVYVMDWGIATDCIVRADGTLQPRGPSRVQGTRPYMAPEQRQGRVEEIDERTDVHGLAAILYEFLSGRPPYAPPVGADADDLIANDQHPQIIYDLRAEKCFPPRLSELIMLALHPERSCRPRNVAAFKAELRAIEREGGWSLRWRCRAGQQIVAQGEPGAHAYYIESGECDVFQLHDGTEQFIRTMHAGEVFGELALLADGKRSASVYARSDVVLLAITRDHFHHTLATSGWLGALLSSLATRFAQSEQASAPHRPAAP